MTDLHLDHAHNQFIPKFQLKARLRWVSAGALLYTLSPDSDLRYSVHVKLPSPQPLTIAGHPVTDLYFQTELLPPSIYE